MKGARPVEGVVRRRSQVKTGCDRFNARTGLRSKKSFSMSTTMRTAFIRLQLSLINQRTNLTVNPVIDFYFP